MGSAARVRRLVEHERALDTGRCRKQPIFIATARYVARTLVRVTQAGPKESDTCRDYVLPRLKAADWQPEQIIEQYPITDGRIVPHGKKHRREKALRADYVLEFRPACQLRSSMPSVSTPFLARACSKRSDTAICSTSRFATTNGKGIVEDDRDTGLELDNLTAFPSPGELWRRYRAWRGIVDDSVADGLILPFNRQLRTPDGRVKEPRYYQRIAISTAQREHRHHTAASELRSADRIRRR